MTTQKAIIYDDSCPMCCWYTGEFVRLGFLKEEGRRSFSELSESEWMDNIDLDRSRDEIPLIDTAGGDTLYGIDSLSYLLGQRLPFIPKALSYRPLRWFFSRLYKFISYNRREIAASPPSKEGIDCTPHFNLFYRLLYLFFSLSVGAMLIGKFTMMYLPGTAIYLVPGVVILLLLPALGWSLQKGVTYAGLMSTVILMMGLLLIPAFWWSALAPVLGGVALAIGGWQMWKRFTLFRILEF
jgi:hypothetical protein